MIIVCENDTMRLSGALHSKRATVLTDTARYLLARYPEGVVVDCGALEIITGSGPLTVVEAVEEIIAEDLRVVFCNLPGPLLRALEAAFGGTRHLPVARSIDEGRVYWASQLLAR